VYVKNKQEISDPDPSPAHPVVLHSSEALPWKDMVFEHRYLVQRRVERAQSLLRSTTLSLDEIATAVGFYDQSHLTRQMRRVLGVTPKYVWNQWY